jgi:hypothetical protein
MAAKQVIDDWWVRVEPEGSFGWLRSYSTIEELKKGAQDLIPEIKRHCDIGYISLEYDGHYECEFCGSELASQDDWGCCEKSEKEHEKEIKN